MKTLFLGDICPTAVNSHLFRQKDIQTLFTDAVKVFERRDFTVAKLDSEGHTDVWRELYTDSPKE